MCQKLSNYLKVALPFVKNADSLIRKKIHMCKTSGTKANDIDFVTESDKEVEKLIIAGLQSNFPDHRFIGEESVGDGGEKIKLTDAPTWIIDPIDGTMNFVHSNYFVCISVGLWINKEPAVGIISVPMFDQIFTAVKGEGSFLNGEKIKVSNVQDLSQSLLMLETGTSREPKKVVTTQQNIENLVPKIHGIRSTGSAAFNMAAVAMGSADAYFEFGIHAWDVAAGCLIITEAGGVVMDPSGGSFDLMSQRLLCASSCSLANQLANELVCYVGPRDDD